jgi:hypothetical protein
VEVVRKIDGSFHAHNSPLSLLEVSRVIRTRIAPGVASGNVKKGSTIRLERLQYKRQVSRLV